MSKLVIVNSNDDLPQTEYLLSQSTITIGRGESNDIIIDDHSVSHTHAVVYTEKNDSFIHDQNSTNGTYVNGKKIRNHALENSDLINIGAVQLQFHFSKQAKGLLEPSGVITVTSGPKEGKKIKLNSSPTTIGDPATQVAAINRHDDKYFFSHVSSHDESYRTKINGKDTPLAPVELHSGDILTVGAVTLEFTSI